MWGLARPAGTPPGPRSSPRAADPGPGISSSTTPNVPSWTHGSPDLCYPPSQRSWHVTLVPTGCLEFESTKRTRLGEEAAVHRGSWPLFVQGWAEAAKHCRCSGSMAQETGDLPALPGRQMRWKIETCIQTPPLTPGQQIKAPRRRLAPPLQTSFGYNHTCQPAPAPCCSAETAVPGGH